MRTAAAYSRSWRVWLARCCRKDWLRKAYDTSTAYAAFQFLKQLVANKTLKKRNGVRDVLAHVTIRYSPTLEHGALYALALSATRGARATFMLSDIEPWVAPMGELDIVQDGGDPPAAITRTKYIERISRLLKTGADEHRVACDILVSDIQGSSAAAAAQLARYARVRDLVILSAYGPLQYPRLDLVPGRSFSHRKTATARAAGSWAVPPPDSGRRLGCYSGGEPRSV
jgi:hypothetical protein